MCMYILDHSACTLRADLTRLENLTMSIKESLRNYSPVPFIQLEFTHDLEIEGRKFPAGTPDTVQIYGVH
ncbi:hypothetical protein DPMN_129432 [Dreissena polymorpha]|uniref:Uncharacterized protein n=1 Tax=Dreissena polymorpha TaxID=45954 RepID=A0A9D4K0I9_DREPO|nr:hypothetical protein DPMN_129432 [Dreissena polymorpha]